MGELQTSQRVPPYGVLRALHISQARFKRLRGLGFFRPARNGSYDRDELQREYEAICELERRVGAIAGDRLTPAERNGAFAWLVEAARAQQSSEPLPDRIIKLLEACAAGTVR
jgi:hypothetical protein